LKTARAICQHTHTFYWYFRFLI